MSDFLFFGIDEAGQAAFSELLRGHDRAALRALAEDRLRAWHAVEIWEGPMCLVRLHRTISAEQPAASFTDRFCA